MKYAFIILFAALTAQIFPADFTLKNKEGKIEHWITCDIFKNWKIYDVNGNGKPDESCFYKSDKNIVYLISTESFDSNGNGKQNIWINFTYKDKNFFKEIKVDANGDGKHDMFRYEKNDTAYMQKSDENFDGWIDKITEYDNNGDIIKESLDKITPGEIDEEFMKNDIRKFMNEDNGNLILSFYEFDNSKRKYFIRNNITAEEGKSLNKLILPLGYNDEKPDTFYYYEKNKVVKEEHDTNNDGKLDLHVTYVFEGDGKFREGLLEKDNNYDGKFDEWHHINNKRQVVKVEKDKDFDGKVDNVKNY